jgi:hypothetical protein
VLGVITNKFRKCWWIFVCRSIRGENTPQDQENTPLNPRELLFGQSGASTRINGPIREVNWLNLARSTQNRCKGLLGSHPAKGWGGGSQGQFGRTTSSAKPGWAPPTFPSMWRLHSSSSSRFRMLAPESPAESPLSTPINMRGGGKNEDTTLSKRALSLIPKAKLCLACV